MNKIMMHKIIHPYDISNYSRTRHYPAFVKIMFTDGRLLLSGVEGPLPSGNCFGGYGQIVIGLSDADIDSGKIRLSDKWTREMFNQLLEYWKVYHLNDMQSACEHQRDLGWTYDTHKGQKCPVCDYEIGTEWKFMEVPEHVINWLFDLPSSDKVPAWI